MQDFRTHHISHSDDLPDTAELVKAELMQVQAALRASQPQIQWQTHQPLSRAAIEKRIKMLKWANAAGAVMQIAIVVYCYTVVFADDAFIGNLFAVLIAALIAGNLYFFHIIMPPRMRQNRIQTTTIMADSDKQKVIIGKGSNQQRSLKYRSKNTLPAFILPEHADADLRRLRDDVQNRLTQITGLPFA